MAEVSERNRAVIEEFRKNAGKMVGSWEGRPLLLLTTTGAKTGQQRITPVMYLPDRDRLLVFASRGGAPTSPASRGGAPTSPGWYHNLLAHPDVTVEAGAETFDATAEVLTGVERDRLYQRQAELYPIFGEYQRRTSRKVPVIALKRKS